MKKTIVSSSVLLLTAVIWGFAFVAQVLGADYADAFTFNGVRFLLGAVSLIPVIFIFEREKMTREKWKMTALASLISGCILFCASSLQQYGIELLSNPGKAGFISGLYMVLTPILNLLIFRKRTGITVWVAVITSVVGLYLLCYDGKENGFSFGLGEAVLLIGAVLWAFHILSVDYSVAHISPLKFSCGQFLICGFLNVLCELLFGGTGFAGIAEAKWSILYCGLLSVGVAYTGQVIGQKLCDDPSRAALLLSSESLFSVIGGVLWNAIPLTTVKVENNINVYTVIGCALIFFSIVFSQLDLGNLRIKKQKNLPKDENPTAAH